MIHEDPDELGYWMNVPEFFPPGYSLSICNKLLTQREQKAIARAALCAHGGFEAEARAARKCAGYDRLS